MIQKKMLNDQTLESVNYLYHGSSELIEETIKVNPSNLLEMKEVVFATQCKWLALLFCAKIKDKDASFGFVNGHPYIEENEKGILEYKMKNKKGYIYIVSKDSFSRDNRLGMINHEFISQKAVKIIETIIIDDVWKEFYEIINKEQIEFM